MEVKEMKVDAKKMERNCYVCEFYRSRHLQINAMNFQNTSYCGRIGNRENAEALSKQERMTEHLCCYVSLNKVLDYDDEFQGLTDTETIMQLYDEKYMA